MSTDTIETSAREQKAPERQFLGGTMELYTLVVRDLDNNGQDILLDRLGDAVIMSSQKIGYGDVTEYHITLASKVMRNTRAHSIACGLGFIAHTK